MVAAGHELTAAAAAEILQDGGNAFDACVAGLFMTFVAEAVFASPGGGGFLMARRAGSDKITLFDFFAETPRKRRPASEIDFYPIYADFGPAKQEFHIGRGLERHARRGAWPLRHASGAVPAADEAPGRARGARGARRLPALPRSRPISSPSSRRSSRRATGVAKIFAPDGTLLQGRRDLPQPRSCRDHRMARRGWRAAVRGRRCRPGHRRAAASDGGYLTHADLADYRVARREPILWRHDGAVVALNPPPAASGALIAFGLGFVQALADAGRALDALALKEAMEATNEARADARRGARRASSPMACWRKNMREAARHPPAHRGTTHVSVIDADGNAASASLSNGEGNGYDRRQIRLHAEQHAGRGGSRRRRARGSGAQGVRLSSMMAPTIILQPDGTVTALGTGGSNRIRTAILQVAVNLLDRGMSLEEAVEAPRLHVERDGKLSFEPGLPEAVETRLPRAWRESPCLARAEPVLRRRACGAPLRRRRRGGRRRSASRRRRNCGVSCKKCGGDLPMS